MSSKRAFVTMLCITQNSTFDTPSGFGSEIGALVHGKMIKMMYSAAMADNVLLHVTSGLCAKSLRLYYRFDAVFDQIITYDGNTKLEQVVFGGYHVQPHLWMKLLVMNMTDYGKVMWLGIDTIPIRPLPQNSFDCATYPCICPGGNADMMVFQPNSEDADRMVNFLASRRDIWDGHQGYDMAFLKEWYPNMAMTTLKMTTPVGADQSVDVVHFTMGLKPWFQAHCQSMDPGATLADALFLGPKRQGLWCIPSAVPDAMYYVFWRIALPLCKPHACWEVDSDLAPVLTALNKFAPDNLCPPFVSRFPHLDYWCKKDTPDKEVDSWLRGGTNTGASLSIRPRSIPKSSSPNANAFVTMLCVLPNSTFDTPSGFGSELGAVVHGIMVNEMSSASMADNVLLHVTSGPCGKRLQLATKLRETFDRIIRFDGKTKLEQVVFGSYHVQPHLWLKLLAMNMTDYQRVMWLGLDTFPIRPLQQDSFDCESYPCISLTETLAFPADHAVDADLMVFTPSGMESDRIATFLANHVQSWDGRPGHHMTLLQNWYRNMSQTRLTLRIPAIANETTDIVHFTMGLKPWFQAYCQSLGPDAILPDADFLGPKSSGGWCIPSPVPDAMFYVFWQIAVEACYPHKCSELDSNLFPIDATLMSFNAEDACLTLATRFPALKSWCQRAVGEPTLLSRASTAKASYQGRSLTSQHTGTLHREY
jgi:alpha-N-acetylglucosamine transferase